MLADFLEKLKTYKLALALGGLGLLLTAIVGMQVFSNSPAPADFPDYPAEQASSAPPVEAQEAEPQLATITVDVKGAVAQEGLYQLPSGSRVNDAILEAGGFLASADKKSVNLAQKLADEAVVYVASQGENISVIAPVTSATSEATTGKVNLNTADLSQLMTITGVGEKRAKDIIAYRETAGGFTSLDDLKNVSGIGDKTLDKIRSEVTVD